MRRKDIGGVGAAPPAGVRTTSAGGGGRRERAGGAGGGRDLLPRLTNARHDEGGDEEAGFFYFNTTRLEGVRVGPWKLRRANAVASPGTGTTSDGSPGGGPKAEADLELFHLDLDPSERINRARDEPAIVARLDARLRAFEASLRRDGGP